MPSGYSNKTGLPVNKGKHWKVKDSSKMHHIAWNKGLKGFNSGEKSPRGMLGKTAWNKGIRGEKSSSWKGGHKNIYKHYKNADYKEWRDKVFTRDNYTCQKCGNRSSVGNPVVIHPHHIKSYTYYPAQRYEVDNGITLCISCHHQLHWGH